VWHICPLHGIAHYIQPFQLEPCYVTLTLVEAHLTNWKHVFNYTQFLLSQVESSYISIHPHSRYSPIIVTKESRFPLSISSTTMRLVVDGMTSAIFTKPKKTLIYLFLNPNSMVNSLESLFIQNCQKLLCKICVIYGELPSFNRLSENWWNV
jgi:hypothetical protein